jgi:hypothetical protein
MRKYLQRAYVALFVVAIAACHGGTSPLPSLENVAQSPLFVDAGKHQGAATQAWGLLLSDPADKPMAKVPVHVYPWTACEVAHRAKLDCAAALVTTKTNGAGRFAFTLPAGHYLLVIGSDSATDFTYDTIHDSIVLTGGSQKLVAPDMPRIPCLYAFGSTPPPDCYMKVAAVERSGNYRISKIWKAEELPCLKTFDADRIAAKLAPAVADEWVAENTRALGRNWMWAMNSGSQSFLSSATTEEGGASPCSVMVNRWFLNTDVLYHFATNPQTRWFGGENYKFTLRGFPNSFSIGEIPPDPRYRDNEGGVTWP